MNAKVKNAFSFLFGGIAIIAFFTGTQMGQAMWRALGATFNITRAYVRRGMRIFWPLKLGEAAFFFIFLLQGQYVAATAMALLLGLELFIALLILGAISNSVQALRGFTQSMAIFFFVVLLLPTLAMFLFLSEHTWTFLPTLIGFWFVLISFGTVGVVAGLKITAKPYYVMLLGVLVSGLIVAVLNRTPIGSALEARRQTTITWIADRVDDNEVVYVQMSKPGYYFLASNIDENARTGQFTPVARLSKGDTLSLVAGVYPLRQQGERFIQVIRRDPTTGLFIGTPIWVLERQTRRLGQIFSQEEIAARRQARDDSLARVRADSLAAREKVVERQYSLNKAGWIQVLNQSGEPRTFDVRFNDPRDYMRVFGVNNVDSATLYCLESVGYNRVRLKMPAKGTLRVSLPRKYFLDGKFRVFQGGREIVN